MELLDGTFGWNFWMELLDGTFGWNFWMELLDGLTWPVIHLTFSLLCRRFPSAWLPSRCAASARATHRLRRLRPCARIAWLWSIHRLRSRRRPSRSSLAHLFH